MTLKELRRNELMEHLCSALDKHQDIGHYGRLVFAIVAQHFLEDEDIVKQLSKNPDFDEVKARALVLQVRAHNYNPPRREKIMEWQSQQEFPICPGGDDPGACNLYRDLKFPGEVYEHIQEFYAERAEAQA